MAARECAPNQTIGEMGNSAVLSDGTLVSIFGSLKEFGSDQGVVGGIPEKANALLQAVRITDGGASISEAITVDDFFMVVGKDKWGPLTLGIPILAADQGDGPFHDRLYATWADGREGRSGIRFSYSPDKGKSWSKSIAVDDLPGPTENKDGPENFLPTVAVNEAGVVAVTWYGRRDTRLGLGWDVRFRASLDGGETWLPSVRISEKPNTFSSQDKDHHLDLAGWKYR